MHSNQGFTLIELLVTIAVLGVIVTLATPSLMTSIQRIQLNNDSRDLVDAMNDLRTEAILQQKEKIFALSPSVTPADKVWIPSGKVIWSLGKPQDGKLTFNMMGRLNETSQCFIFLHNKNRSLKSVVIVRKSGMIIFNKTTDVCPSNLGED